MAVWLLKSLAWLIAAACSADGRHFTDADLSKTIHENPWVVIYSWSPFMPLSMIGAEEVLTVEQNGFRVCLVGDPSLRVRDIIEANSPIIASPRLQREGNVMNHYPTAVLYIHGRRIWNLHGYDSLPRLSERLEKARKENP